MKKIIAIFLIMIILFALVSNVVFAKTGTINTTTVRMRREANTSSDILQLIGEESEVEILGEENGWYRVEYDGITGYVSSDYVDVEGEEPDETNPTDVSEEPVGVTLNVGLLSLVSSHSNFWFVSLITLPRACSIINNGDNFAF